MALALAAGAALPPAGFPFLPAAALLLAASFLPVPPFHRPAHGRKGRPRSALRGGGRSALRVRWLPLAALAGLAHGQIDSARTLRDCRWSRLAGEVQVRGWVSGVETPRRFRLRVVDGPCPGEVRVQAALPAGAAEGSGLGVRGRWVVRSDGVPGQDPVAAGVVVSPAVEPDATVRGGVGASLAGLRAAGLRRVRNRFDHEAALVSALLFARRDGLGPEVREAFTRTGTAHLLAISGFHVGVLAGIVIWLVGRRAPPARAYAAGTAAAWGYVGVLGLPDAATRAALLLTLASVGRWVGRPVSAAGALGTALLLLVVTDPGVAARIGAQLSFAGALGLAVLARRWTEAGVSEWRRRRGVLPGPRVRSVVEAVAVTTAATLATLPFVAWHFEQVSMVALPASLVATPMVALALPAVLAALLLDALPVPGAGAAAAVAALGAEGLLGATRLWVEAWAAIPWASLPVARPAAAAAVVGGAAAWALVRTGAGVGDGVRGLVVTGGVGAGLLAWPVSDQLMRNGALEVHMFDVGQGDAFGIRTPAGRWLVVDAGPPTGARLLRDLRRVGVRRVELLFLSHPDADHVGGAAALIEGLDVGSVAGPGTVRGAGPWRDAVEEARSAGVPWRVLARGDALTVDGVRIRVLHPDAPADAAGPPSPGSVRPAAPAAPVRDPNAASLVLTLEWRGATMLFTGDAPVEVERALLPALGALEVLKVGHHGSRTSTDSLVLDRLRPQVALVSAGRGNRYGHPAPEVLARLEASGAEVWRTDRVGPVRIRVSRTGTVTVEARR